MRTEKNKEGIKQHAQQPKYTWAQLVKALATKWGISEAEALSLFGAPSNDAASKQRIDDLVKASGFGWIHCSDCVVEKEKTKVWHLYKGDSKHTESGELRIHAYSFIHPEDKEDEDEDDGEGEL